MREASVGHDCPIVISDSGESSDGTASGAEAAKPTSQQSVGSLGCSQGSGQRGQLTLLLKQQQLAPGNRSSQPMDSARSRYGKKQGTAAASGRKKAPAKGKGMLLQLTASTSAAAAPKQPCPPPVQSEPRAPFLSTEPSAKHLVAPGGSEFPAAAAGDADAGASWSTKYAPESAAELVVHKKKVDELRAWMQHCAGKCGLPAAGCLLLTGPPGCGKTAAVCLLASEQGLSVTEWVPPAGVTWEEHQRNHRGGSAEPSPSPSSSGRRFHSKLDEFDDYVGRSTLFASLQLQRRRPGAPGGAGLKRGGQGEESAGGKSDHEQKGARGRLLLVDDLPHAANSEQRTRLAQSLRRLARTTRFPAVIITTSGDRSGASAKFSSAALGNSHGLHKELLSALDEAGIHVVSLNPITSRNAAKALRGIARKMGIVLAERSAAEMAEASGGDLRNAIESLQLHLLGHRQLREPSGAEVGRPGAKRRRAAAGAAVSIDRGGAAVSGMDSGLSLFHALGKLLHNKRGDPADLASDTAPQLCRNHREAEPAPASSSVGSATAEPMPPLPLAERFRRLPSSVDPEGTVLRSQMDGDSVMAFLQENLHDFVDDECIGAAADCLEYLSAGDALLGRAPGGAGGGAGPSAAGTSVVARARSSWQPLRPPALWAARTAAAHNQEQIGEILRLAGHSSAVLSGCVSYLASEVLPFLRCLHCGSPRYAEALDGVLPSRWMYVVGGRAELVERACGRRAAGGGTLGAADSEGAGEGAGDPIEDC
uniref:Cell cycle checkpoint protein n=1 Tax=Tetraselmis sp. GSL018 TaxID=582737 RepID=A0A061QSZ1_9CHLO